MNKLTRKMNNVIGRRKSLCLHMLHVQQGEREVILHAWNQSISAQVVNFPWMSILSHVSTAELRGTIPPSHALIIRCLDLYGVRALSSYSLTGHRSILKNESANYLAISSLETVTMQQYYIPTIWWYASCLEGHQKCIASMLGLRH
jgi:hypothetical protein